MHTRPTSKATSLSYRSQVALALPSVVIVQNAFNSVNTLRRQMLRKQPQHASNDTALTRIGSAEAAASTCTAPQQASASAACTTGGYSRVMPELYSANDAGRSQEHNPLPATQSRAVAASQEILQPRAVLPQLSMMLGKSLAASLPPRGPAESAPCLIKGGSYIIHHARSVLLVITTPGADIWQDNWQLCSKCDAIELQLQDAGMR